MKRLTSAEIFLDGGDPAETAEATRLLNEAGYTGLDGQTTNPSLIARNPDIAARIEAGRRLTDDEPLAKYKEIVEKIKPGAPGAISIEVYADHHTTAVQMAAQAREMASWAEGAVIKLPITEEGLKAARLLKNEVRLNLTLCFSQQQAAAVYAATFGSSYPVYVSPFIGRLDDKGLNGMELVENMLRMYQRGDGHVKVLAASLRHVDHVRGTLRAGVAAITVPFEKAFRPWAEAGFPLPPAGYKYAFDGGRIPYQELELGLDWTQFDWRHELTDAGLQKFVDDWRRLCV